LGRVIALSLDQAGDVSSHRNRVLRCSSKAGVRHATKIDRHCDSEGSRAEVQQLLQTQWCQARDWLGANATKGRVEPETVVNVGLKARLRRRNGWRPTHFGKFHALLERLSKCVKWRSAASEVRFSQDSQLVTHRGVIRDDDEITLAEVGEVFEEIGEIWACSYDVTLLGFNILR
jgi:hypothetical protein